jgi:hypothetical protein
MLQRLLTAVFLLTCIAGHSQVVRYDEGAVIVNGVTFLQDARDSSKYYYLPRFPHLAQKDDGTFQFVCLKYVGDKQENSGGLFHALIDFTIPAEVLKTCEADLQKINAGARIMGQVPLMEERKQKEDEDDVQPSFEIVSAVLSNKNGKDALTRSVVSSGHAPFTPGSQAAIASVLSPQGTTLLWSSFSGPTSDVSVAVNGYYEAMVRAYNAVVTADMTVIYKHFSKMTNVQQDYDKKQIRRVIDTLMRNGTIKVDVADRSAGLGIKVTDMEGILSTITNKVTEAMFDSKTGWSAAPDTVDPNLGFDPRGRRGDKTSKGAIGDAIGAIGESFTDMVGALPLVGFLSPKKTDDPKYITDNQYVLKDVHSIRSNKFYLNLSKSVSIKVPFHTAGNLSLLYDKLGKDERYFRVVNMNDADYQDRSIVFQVDGNFVDAFGDIINFVSVNFRKKYGDGREDFTAQLMINGSDLSKGTNLKDIVYHRLGITGSDWLNYEYQVIWSFKSKSKSIRQPAGEDQWLKSSAPAISLIPPLTKEIIELDADRQEFGRNGVASVNINFASMLAGDKQVVRTSVLRVDDKSSTNTITIYHDKDTPVVYQPTWYSKDNGKAVSDLAILNGGYLFLVPPASDKFVR